MGITINIKTRTTSLDEARQKIRQFSHSSVSDVQATSAALRVMEGNMTNNLRAAERFTAKVLGLGPILQAAFPIVGAVAFLGVIGELGKRVYDFFQTASEAPKKLKEGFYQADQSIQLTNDGLRVAIAELENANDKLKGKPENGMKLAIAEARQEADRLGDSLDKDLKKIEDAQKESTGSWWQQKWQSLEGNASTTDIQDEMQRFRLSLRGQGTDQQASLLEAELTKVTSAIAAEQKYQKLQNSRSGWPAGYNNPSDFAGNGISGDVSGRIGNLQEYQRNLQFQKDEVNLTQERGSDQAESNKLKATAEADAQWEKNEQAIKEWQDQQDRIGRAFQDLDKKTQESNDAMAKVFEKADIKNKGIEPKVNPQPLTIAGQTFLDPRDAMEWQKNIRATNLNISGSNNLAGAAFGGQDAIRQAELENRIAEAKEKGARQDEIDLITKESQTEYASQILLDAGKLATAESDRMETLNREIDALKQENASTTALRDLEKERLQIASDFLLKQNSASAGVQAFFLQMQEQGETTAQIINTALTQAVDQTSSNLANLILDQKPKKTTWGQMFGKEFMGIGHDMLSSTIKSGLGKVLGGAGKADGLTANTAWWVRMAGSTGGSSKDMDNLPGDPKNLPSSGGSNGSSGLRGLLQKLFHKNVAAGQTSTGDSLMDDIPVENSSIPGFAEGSDDIAPGTLAMVGEKGPELAYFGNGGSVTPNDKLGGNNGDTHIHNNIDARGADLGASNRILRSMEMMHNSAVKTAMLAEHERKHRIPKRKS